MGMHGLMTWHFSELIIDIFQNSAVLRRVYEEDEDKLLQKICSNLIDQFAQSNKWLGRQM